MEPSRQVAEARQQPRLKIPAMYSLVRVKPVGAPRYEWTGHIYDVSLSGMRFEIDQALAPGTAVEVRCMLPGSKQTTFHAEGKVVRFHDDADEPGPVRMGMHFDRFHHEVDHEHLESYLDHSGLRLAA